ncbi:hypothetical protein [Algoriphagus boritolerans]|uniref:hypothetical protein n=1 Tax=Algoriphagus boritolerans TaxID=308111 RepID=UPI000AF7A2B9
MINDGTKEGKELQEYYNIQKYWILVNRAESYFGLGDFDLYRKNRDASNNVPFHQWQLESFTEQIGKLAAEMKKSGASPRTKMDFSRLITQTIILSHDQPSFG